ncbi:MAG: hypothetical protein R3E89_07755 [Thiolinea sp.]
MSRIGSFRRFQAGCLQTLVQGIALLAGQFQAAIDSSQLLAGFLPVLLVLLSEGASLLQLLFTGRKQFVLGRGRVFTAATHRAGLTGF